MTSGILRILHVVPSYFPARAYGGPLESVHRLCCHLRRPGVEVRVLTTNADGLKRVLDVDTACEVDVAGGLQVRYCRRLLRHSVSPSLLRRLPSFVCWSDVVHLTAVYSFPTIPTLAACRILRRPVVWSPRGALQRWRGTRRPRFKTIWEHTCRLVAPRRLRLHVTSEDEEHQSLARLPGVRTVLIPNGVDVPDEVKYASRGGDLKLLYLGRLDPKKGIENLLEACRLLPEGSAPVWRLAIAGDGAAEYRALLERRVEEIGFTGRIVFLGHVDGEAKRLALQAADVGIVPSYGENFGIAIAEMLANGVPVIASRGTPWSRLDGMGCGLWVDNDPSSLAKAITQISAMPLRDMGNRGHEWMKQEEFSWQRVADDMLTTYTELTGRP